MARGEGGRKAMWHLYRAHASERKNDIARPYLKVIGIPSSDKVHDTGEIK